ncbi:MAG: DMT family transporter [Candidatus Bathyarchaeota archaeon]|jgi:drug/metabolite transporter (DMT)-like permease|nr:DMT family transporter [Candidatus Bathyarchaeota archaeon]
MHARTRKLALAEGLAAGILFGTAAIFIKLLHGLDAYSIAFWRLLIAALAIALALLLLKRSLYLNTVKGNLKDLTILSIFLALHFVFFASAVKDTTILNATVLVNTAPIFSMFVSSFLFKLKPSRFAIIGLAISLLGVLIIAYGETANTSANTSEDFSSTLKGDMEAVLAAVVEAFYLSYGRKTRNQMNILSTMFPIYLLTALFVGAIAIPVTATTPTPPSTLEMLMLLVGLGMLPTAVSHTLYFSSLSNLKSFETATLALLEPIGATVLGIAIFQEMPLPIFIAGAAMVMTGILFIVAKEG